MRNVKYDYSSVHVNLPSDLSEEIVSWGVKNVKDDDIFVSQQDPTFGREDDIHITVLYGLHCDDSTDVKPLTKNLGPLSIELRSTEVFTYPSRFDVLVINVFSPQLKFLNEKLRTLPFTNLYGSYRPHVTIAYLKKGKGKQHRNLDHWNGRKFYCTHAIFSSKNGIKERVDF